MICLRLAKAGYAGGYPSKIEDMPVDWVMKILHYENFCESYEEQYLEINKTK